MYETMTKEKKNVSDKPLSSSYFYRLHYYNIVGGRGDFFFFFLERRAKKELLNGTYATGRSEKKTYEREIRRFSIGTLRGI